MNTGEYNDPKGQGMPPPYTDTPQSPPTAPLYPPLQPGGIELQQQQHQHGQPTVIPVLVGTRPMGPKPSSLTCPSCNAEITTRVQYMSSTKTHLFALGLCLLFWPLVCLPYLLSSCQNADHYCPNCNAYIGSYKN
ncbi:unnamed protein product [Spodoptera littoralis]|uniref:LITAF domain-containing protein n=1 Tax=Spodoptera littoralis TaxID=7109 RepID=A0A9P0MVP1_SPOLI|nr:unnamed protein product [Spodoptera littoralis]CAH1635086.1 unnamed protein product [Spodoptera littoralis]